MTITELLADLEAKATQAKADYGRGPHKTIPNKTGGHRVENADGRILFIGSATKEECDMMAACSPDRILALVAYVRTLERVVSAARKEVDMRKGIQGSHVFRHDVVLHGGIEHRVGTPCELCDSLKTLDELPAHLDAERERAESAELHDSVKTREINVLTSENKDLRRELERVDAWAVSLEGAIQAQGDILEKAEADLRTARELLRWATEFVALVYRRGGDTGMENSGGLLDEIHTFHFPSAAHDTLKTAQHDKRTTTPEKP